MINILIGMFVGFVLGMVATIALVGHDLDDDYADFIDQASRCFEDADHSEDSNDKTE